MPKNKKKGANKNRRKNNTGGAQKLSEQFQISMESDDHMIALVIQKCGGQFVDVLCEDGKKRKLYLRNRIKKSVWLNQGT